MSTFPSCVHTFSLPRQEPGRTDLNSLATLIIQDTVVDTVQSVFDKLDSTIPGNVNLKVLGKLIDPVPESGPYMHVYIGDGQHTNTNPNTTAGIATFDVFNQSQENPLIFTDNIFRAFNKSGDIYAPFTTEAGSSSSIPVSLNQIGGVKDITREHVINAISSVIAHEVGHALGLEHLKNTLDYIMNAGTSSPLNDGHKDDELRKKLNFRNSSQRLDPDDYSSNSAEENSGARLAFAVGSDISPDQLTRGAPDSVVLQFNTRTKLKMAANTTFPSLPVASAIIGIVPNGNSHLKPELINLGTGDLKQLLDREIQVRNNDQIFVIASTTGFGFDVFGVAANFQGSISSIDLSSIISIFTEPNIRGELFDNQQQPVSTSLVINQVVNGTPQVVGSLGSPDAVGISVPSVVGLNQASAEAAITNAELAVGTITTQNSATVPAGNVISQNPLAGTSVAPGTAVDLVVSLGPVVPDAVGQTQASAEAAIVSAGLTVGTITTQHSSTIAAGIVISQNPIAGTNLAIGAAVNLVISLGPKVPDVVGLTQSSAETAIIDAGLTVGTITKQNSSTIAAGIVISQTPAADTSASLSSPVDLVVSLGPKVPDVVGLSESEAETAIIEAGLTLGTITSQHSDTVPPGDVISQSPTAGTNAALNSAVNLVVSSIAIDVKAGSCPNPWQVSKKGVMPIAILGSDIFDVSSIDPASVRIGVKETGQVSSLTPTRSSLEDTATPYIPSSTAQLDASSCVTAKGDGFVDLNLKFDATSLAIDLLLNDAQDREVVMLMVTAETFDGKILRGEDRVVILNKSK